MVNVWAGNAVEGRDDCQDADQSGLGMGTDFIVGSDVAVGVGKSGGLYSLVCGTRAQTINTWNDPELLLASSLLLAELLGDPAPVVAVDGCAFVGVAASVLAKLPAMFALSLGERWGSARVADKNEATWESVEAVPVTGMVSASIVRAGGCWELFDGP